MDQQQPPPQRPGEPPQQQPPQQQWQQPPPQQQWQQQPQQGWTPPPQQPMGWGGPGYAAPPPRPLGVTLASIFLLVMGVLFLLGGACSAAFGGVFSGAEGQIGDQVPPGFVGFFTGFLFVAAILALIFGIAQIAAGAGAISGRGWARWIGIVFSIILAIVIILIGVSSMNTRDGAGVAITFLVIGVF